MTEQHNYSNIVWSNGQRKGENFQSVEILILDIDEGYSIDQMKKKLEGYQALIVTTKHHQSKMKNGKEIAPRDRYRLFLPLAQPIDIPMHYKQIITGVIKEFKADEACKDLARYYYCNPNQEVYFLEGVMIDVEKYLTDVKNSENTSKKEPQQERIRIEDNKMIKSSDGTEKRAIDWFKELNDDDKQQVHCPLAPQAHKNNDASASCTMSKRDDWINFYCHACLGRGFFHYQKPSKTAKKVVIPVINKAEILREIGSVPSSLLGVVDLLVQHLPVIPEREDKDEKRLDDTYEIIHNIEKKTLLPIKAFGETLYIYSNGKWDSFATLEEEKLRLIKPLIEKSIGDRRRVNKKQLELITAELKMNYIQLDAYSKLDGVFINMYENVVSIDKKGEVQTLPHDAKYGFRWKLDFNYNEGAICPQFRKFLDEVIGDDETIRVIQEFMGYVLIPHKQKNYEKALWTIGHGSNGKSVFNNIISKLYGDANTSYLNLDEISNDEKRVLLKGKLLNISSDAVNRINSSDFKRIVSGEKIIGRELYKGVTYIDTLPKLLIATNEMPNVTGGTDAFLRRVLLITFDKVIKEEDRDVDLEKKISREIEGIFNYALDGLKRLLKQNGFTESQAIKKAILEFRGELDVLPDFLLDYPIVEDHGKGSEFIIQAELFKKLADWCKDNNRRNNYKSPKQIRDRLVNFYHFTAYKNDTVYGIRGMWKNNGNDNNYPVPTEDKDPYE